MSYCNNNSDYHHTCYESHTIYCCSSHSTAPYSCGKYTNSCFEEYYGKKCTGMWIGLYITNGICLLSLIILIALAYIHKRRINSMWMNQYMRQNENITYSNNYYQPQPVISVPSNYIRSAPAQYYNQANQPQPSTRQAHEPLINRKED